MSLGPIYRKTVQLAVEHAGKIERFLDIGAGRGEMVHMLREKTRGESFVCDYTDKLLQVPDQKVDIADLNTDPLPYPDNHFDLVTATEVIEHLENHRAVMRDIFRVLKPGGLCVLSTPNILNIGSRLRFLWFGFWNLFGPLLYATATSTPRAATSTPSAIFTLPIRLPTPVSRKWSRISTNGNARASPNCFSGRCRSNSSPRSPGDGK